MIKKQSWPNNSCFMLILFKFDKNIDSIILSGNMSISEVS